MKLEQLKIALPILLTLLIIAVDSQNPELEVESKIRLLLDIHAGLVSKPPKK